MRRSGRGCEAAPIHHLNKVEDVLQVQHAESSEILGRHVKEIQVFETIVDGIFSLCRISAAGVSLKERLQPAY
jgi:hypothetical protein